MIRATLGRATPVCVPVWLAAAGSAMAQPTGDQIDALMDWCIPSVSAGMPDGEAPQPEGGLALEVQTIAPGFLRCVVTARRARDMEAVLDRIGLQGGGATTQVCTGEYDVLIGAVPAGNGRALVLSRVPHVDPAEAAASAGTP